MVSSDSDAARLVMAAALDAAPRFPPFHLDFVRSSVRATAPLPTSPSGASATPLVFDTALISALIGHVTVNAIDHLRCELVLSGSATAVVDRDLIAHLTLRDASGAAAGDDIDWSASASASTEDGVSFGGGAIEIEAYLARSGSGERVLKARVEATAQPGRLRLVRGAFGFARCLMTLDFFSRC